MDIKQSLGNLMKEAQKMQEKMQDAQKELALLVVTGESGGGLVKVEMNGRHDVLSTKMNSNLLDEDIEMIQDLVTAAVNDAVQKIEKESKGKISELTAGMKLPDDFSVPGGDE